MDGSQRIDVAVDSGPGFAAKTGTVLVMVLL